MIKTVFMVGQLKEHVQVLDVGRKERYEMPCCWAEGMIGAFAAFGTREAAEKYLDGSAYPIIEYDVDEPLRH